MENQALINGNLLQLFAVLYSTRSVSKSADLMGLSQPTVSVWLGKLREQLGDDLFVRTGGGMLPTKRADELIGHVSTALDALKKISVAPDAFSPSKAHQTFRICMTDASHMTLLPRLLLQIRQQAPSVRIDAVPIDDQTAKSLEGGEVDLALGIIPGLETGFYQQTFYEQSFVCLVGQGHPTIKRQMTWDAYLEAGHVEVLSGKSYSLLDSALKQQNIYRKVRLQLPGFLGLATLVATTDLVATVPSQIGEILAKNASLQILKCPIDVPSFTVKQYWHARAHKDVANQWLRSLCATIFMNDSYGNSMVNRPGPRVN
jgi:DNA-binding transcriptional LysR family regulator